MHLIQQENSHNFKLKESNVFNMQDRQIVVNWLVGFTLNYKSDPKVIFLTVNLMDRFLTKFEVQ